eukprot:4796674-Prymnesium_polylepis.1
MGVELLRLARAPGGAAECQSAHALVRREVAERHVQRRVGRRSAGLRERRTEWEGHTKHGAGGECDEARVALLFGTQRILAKAPTGSVGEPPCPARGTRGGVGRRRGGGAPLGLAPVVARARAPIEELEAEDTVRVARGLAGSAEVIARRHPTARRTMTACARLRILCVHWRRQSPKPLACAR